MELFHEASQRSLFGYGPHIAPDSSVDIRRVELGDGAWVDHATGWLAGHEVLFDHLLDTVAWRRQRRPMYDRIVDVPRLLGDTPDDPTSRAAFDAIQRALDRRYGTSFDRVGLALYRTGADSVAWHGDQVAREMPEAFVATVSLGSPRTFALRPKSPDAGARIDFRLGHGDLVVMGGSCQRTWEHAVPKVRAAGPRIALMFRPVWSSSAPTWLRAGRPQRR